MVVSDRERPACAGLIDAAASAGALTAVTAGSRPVTVLAAGAAPVQVPVPGLPDPVDDLGAGDVFAAALFVALSEGREPREAVGIASAAAAVRMGGQGPDAIGDAPAIRARATSGAG
jgi:sugar/nucleoside kinase (ribokinase family)